jgi:hypothetical protein
LRELYLTFDIEDVISCNSVEAIETILKKLNSHNLNGLFFITGHMAEKLADFPEVVALLNEHQIGYHSSSHTVHPTIFEFSDIPDYQEIYKRSLQRESSHINPLTGKIEGPGGIISLRSLFPKKEIVAFRAPGYCWHPAHLEALKTLGIEFDFSANIAPYPVKFKKLIFYPFPILPSNWLGTGYNYRLLLRKMLIHQTTILTIHPSDMVNDQFWDSIYSTSNPPTLTPPPTMDSAKSLAYFEKFDLLLQRIKWLNTIGLLDITPLPKKNHKKLNPSYETVNKCYRRSLEWAHYLKYEPRYFEKHFFEFFGVNC